MAGDFVDNQAVEDEGVSPDKQSPQVDEEDEDDGDEEADKELQGFIVDDAEANEANEEEEEDEEEEDDDDKLDEEDLELIQENLRQEEEAVVKSRGFRRLKRAAQSSDEEDDDDSGARKKGLFDDEVGEEEMGVAGDEYGDAGEGWMAEVDDEEVYSAGLTASQQSALREIFGLDLQTLMDVLGGRRPKVVDTGAAEDYDGEGERPYVQAPKMELSEEDVAREAIRIVDEPERLVERYKHRPRPVPEAILQLEATWMVEKFRTHAATFPLPFTRLIRASESEVGNNCSLYASYPLCDLFDEEKQRQRYDQVLKTDASEGQTPEEVSEFPRNPKLEEDLAEKIQAVLDLLLNERYEVSYINTHHGHRFFPPLTPEAVWKIYQWDVQWWRINELKKTLLTELKRIPDVSSELTRMLTETNDETVLQDFKHYIPSKIRTSGIEQDENKAVDDGKRRAIKRRRTAAPTDGLFHKYFLESGLRDRWAPHIMSPEAFVTVLRDKEAEMANEIDGDVEMEDEDAEVSTSAPPPPSIFTERVGDDGSSAMTTWLKQVAGTAAFTSPDRLFEGIVRFEGRVLALHPSFKEYVRSWLWDKLFVTTVTTSKGERQMDPIKPNWMGCRLYRRPIRQIWSDRPSSLSLKDSGVMDCLHLRDPVNAHDRWRREMMLENDVNRSREIALEILKAEKNELAICVIHPIAASDPAPWRVTGSDDLRWRRGKARARERTVQSQRARHYGSNTAEQISDGQTDPYAREWLQLEASDREDEATINNFVQQITRFFCPPRSCPDVWKRLLSDIVQHAVVKEVLPAIRKEVKARMIALAEEYVLDRCQQTMLWRLAEAPPAHKLAENEFLPSWPDFSAMIEDDDADDDDVLTFDEAKDYNPVGDDGKQFFDNGTMLMFNPVVSSIIIERDADAGKARVHVATVNRQGILSDFQRYDMLFDYFCNNDQEAAHKKEAAKFENFLLHKKTRPNIVLIGANCLAATNLMAYLKHVQRRIKSERNRWELRYVSLEVPQLFAQSDICPSDLRENHGVWAAQALSAARFAQNPLAEYCNLWNQTTEGKSNYLLSLRLHHLQSEVSRDMLEQALMDVLIRVVNDCGVYINRLRTFKHQRSLLQFVCGLGPVKANNFLSHFYSPIGKRLDLMDNEQQGDSSVVTSIPPKVFDNCAPFIRIRGGDEFGLESDDQCDPLDDSRIHSEESVTQAKKMCRDAQEDLLADRNDDRAFIDATFKHPEALEELDLEAYAGILAKQGRPRMLPLLEFVKREVETPFKDPRCPPSSPSAEEIFFRITGEDPILFRTGSEVHIRRSVHRNNTDYGGHSFEKGWVVEPSGISAFVTDHSNLRPQDTHHDTLLKARLNKIKYDTVEVDVCQSPDSLRFLLQRVVDIRREKLTLSPLIDEDLEVAISMKRRNMETALVELPKTRRINHPMFRPCSQVKLLEYMRAQGSVGQAFIRVSESTDYLLLYIQTCLKPFKYKALHIKEAGDTDATTKVAAELTLNGVTFHALDEVLGSYCQPFKGFLNDIYQHEKFHAQTTPDDLATKLTTLAQRDFRAIQWGLALDPTNLPKDAAERFVLVAVCNSSRTGQPHTIQDSLYVTPKGFRLWMKTERNIWNLLNWWKTEGFKNRQRYWGEYQRAKANGGVSRTS